MRLVYQAVVMASRKKEPSRTAETAARNSGAAKGKAPKPGSGGSKKSARAGKPSPQNSKKKSKSQQTSPSAKADFAKKLPATAAAHGRKARAAAKGKRGAGAKKSARGPGAHSSAAIPIVGIGASAGGLEAFTRLLAALPADTGMAFVVVSHLSHAHKSILTELLAKTTAMRVSQVTASTAVLANCVFVIAPNMNLSIGDGVIQVSALDQDRRSPMSIDFFLRSLAESRKSAAIGVLLSGTGTDGTLGLAAIKAEGGITFAQDEASARYADMPRSATQAGSADYVLSPEQIAVELTRIARHPYLVERKSAPLEEDSEPAGGLNPIFALIRSATGVDFSLYKPTTITRRVSRRMLLHKIERIADYLAYLKKHREELDALYQDLLISVTGFFRDAEAYQFLQKEILPKIVAARSGDQPIRAWIPGCATGEEVYSVAMCLLETLKTTGPNPPLQIFATDVSKNAIKRAREGFYAASSAGEVSPERLRRFFVPVQGGYQISKAVRDLCVFAPQDLVKDPPFSRIDLISCRNVLIYLGTPLQRHVLQTFHYALKPSGFLVLGSSETTNAAGEMYEQVDRRHKVYTKVHSALRLQLDLPRTEAQRDTHGPPKPKAEAQGPDLSKEADRIVLARHTPAGVVVNPALEIVQFRGRTSRYLEAAPGEASLNLFRMARQGLVIDLRSAVHQAQKGGAASRKEGVQLRVDGDVLTLNIEVVPLSTGNASRGHLLVLFEEVAAPTQTAGQRGSQWPAGKGRGATAQKEVQALHRELAAVQEDLHSIIEEQEASNEELQSANEEILSANEELQSTSEEMETAKEELQATNEELTTVNEELQNRNAELLEANNDLQNLISASDVVMVMVGQDLRIRRITPTAQRALNLIPADIGRPLSNIKTNLKVVDLERLIANVIDRVTAAEMEVQDLQGHWYSMSIRPYRTEDNKIEGAVLVLVDIDLIKRSGESEAMWRALVEPLPDFILSADPPGKVLFLSRTAASLAKTAAVGESIYDFLNERDLPNLKRCLRKVVATGKPDSFRSGSGPDAGKTYETRVQPIKNKGSVVALTMTTAKDD